MRTQTVLEGYLSHWEDIMFVLNVYQKLHRLTPVSALEHSLQFRQTLLSAYSERADDLDRFYLPDRSANWGEDEILCDIGRAFNTVPLELFEWTRSSRRVFKISHEMQHAFEHISVADVPMDDIVWPFGSFLIELAQPILHPHTSWKVTNILLSSPMQHTKDYREADPEKLTTLVSFLAESCNRYHSIDTGEKQAVLASLKTPAQKKAHEFLGNRGAKRIRDAHQFGRRSLLIRNAGSRSVREYFDIPSVGSMEKSVLRVVFNLCLFLEGIGAKSDNPLRFNRRQRVQGAARNAITDSMQVCDVNNLQTLYSLSSETGKTEGKGHEITEPHWRRRHKRRPPGLGADPSAEKSVKVKPALVRPDLIPQFGLPGGTITKI